MRHYPVFLNPESLHALVVGAGEVGVRKIGTLLECGAASVLALDMAPASEALAPLMGNPALTFEQRGFVTEDLSGRTIAFACTGNTVLNALVGREARARGIPVNVADAPADSTFIVPSSVSQDPLTVAFSTGGASPAMARRIRREMQEYFGPHYGLFLRLMERIRPLVLGLGMETPANTKIFRELTACGLLDALRDGNRTQAASMLEEILPGELAPKIGELLDGIH